MTVDDFIKLHPQFVNASPDVVANALVQAANAVDVAEFGDDYQQAFELEACHIIAIEMYGQQASIKGGETTQYKIKFDAIVRRRILGATVI